MAASVPKVTVTDSETREDKKKEYVTPSKIEFISRVCQTALSNRSLKVYKVQVHKDGVSWFIFRRYNEFSLLHEKLKKVFPKSKLKIPKKGLFPNISAEFRNKRQDGLDNFIKQLVTDPDILAHAEVQIFLDLKGKQYVPPLLSPEEDDPLESFTDRLKGESSSSADEDSRKFNLGPSEKRNGQPSDFEFLKVIGKGTFGKVLLAKRKEDEVIYAVKVLQKSHIIRKNEVKHIMSERNVLLKNVKHPFLVGLHYSFQTTDKLYFVLDYVNGGELFFHIQRERVFDEKRAKFYAAEMASAVGYLHSIDIIYRDLKPENILLDCYGHIVLTDFGLCKEGIHASETTSTFCGTPEYLAPEILLKQAYDHAVDWWCLGAVLYEMLYGLPPFYNRDIKKMQDDKLKKPLKLRETTSVEARNILQGLLQKKSEQRLGGVSDFQEIKCHPFFSSIDWVLLDNRSIEPPYNPRVESQMDLKHFDPNFTKEPISNSYGRSISASVQEPDNLFLGFSYVQSYDGELSYL